MNKPVTKALLWISILNAIIWTTLLIMDLCRGDQTLLVTILHGIAALLFDITAVAYLWNFRKTKQ